ncbi:MAG: ATP-binding cassette domain-containing protein, partial [Bradymonadia bacterium]
MSRVCFLIEGSELMASVGFCLEDGTLQFEDGTVAFRALDLTLEPGQLNVILGPSGCGKTTLLRVLGGLLPLTTGALTFNTSSTARVTKLPKTSFCFQEPRLLPWRNVNDNIALPGVLSGEASNLTVEQLLDQVELSTEHAHLLPSELSG